MRLNLVPHPDTPPAAPGFSVWASIDIAASLGATGTAHVDFGVGAPAGRFVIPPPALPQRIDGLWNSTCFEAFLRPKGQVFYREWNFSPSSHWAAYDFDGYREDRADAAVTAPPYIRMEDNLTWWSVGAAFVIESGQRWNLGLSAVLKEKDGTKSYWALAHPPGQPDFHHDDCFAVTVA